MKVLFVSHTARLHGAERSLVESARSLAARAADVHVALPEHGPLEEELLRTGVPVTVAASPWLWWATTGELGGVEMLRSGAGVLRRSRGPLKSLRGVLASVRPDVVVSNTLTSPYGAVAARREGVRHVWYVREFGRDDLGLRFFLGEAPTLRVLGALSDQVVACSSALSAKLARHVRPTKLCVVYNAVEAPALGLDPSTARDGGPLRLLTLGRLHPGKGQEDAVRATALLVDAGYDVQLRLVGGGSPDYARRLAQLAACSTANGRVTFADFTHAPQLELARCDAFLMTSRSEAFGRVTVEAMKAGRAVVAAREGGGSELVHDGWNGLLYRAGDAAGLARQIARLCDDDSLGAQLATRAQEWATATFTLERHGSELAGVLARVSRGEHVSGAVRPAILPT